MANTNKHIKMTFGALLSKSGLRVGFRLLIAAGVATLSSCATPSSDAPPETLVDVRGCTQSAPMSAGLANGVADVDRVKGVAQSCLSLIDDAGATNMDIANGAFQAGGLFLAIADATEGAERSWALARAVQALELSRNRITDENAVLMAASDVSDQENVSRRKFKYDRVMQLARSYIEIAAEDNEASRSACGGKPNCLHKAVDLLEQTEAKVANPFSRVADQGDGIAFYKFLMRRIEGEQALFEAGEVGGVSKLLRDLNTVMTGAKMRGGEQGAALSKGASERLAIVSLELANRELKRPRQTTTGLESAIEYFQTVISTGSDSGDRRLDSLLGQGEASERLAVLRSGQARMSDYCKAEDVFGRAASLAKDENQPLKEARALDGQAGALNALISAKAGACSGAPSAPTSTKGRQIVLEDVLVRILATEASQFSQRALSARTSLADIYLSQGRVADAEKILDVSIPSGVVGANAAQISLLKAEMAWRENGPTAEVGALLSSAVAANPMDSRPQLQLGRYWFERADAEKAWSHLKLAREKEEVASPRDNDQLSTIYSYLAATALERTMQSGSNRIAKEALHWAQQAAARDATQVAREQLCRAAIIDGDRVKSRTASGLCRDLPGPSGDLLNSMLALREAQFASTTTVRRNAFLAAADRFDAAPNTSGAAEAPNWMVMHDLPEVRRLMSYGRVIARRCAGQSNIAEPSDPDGGARKFYKDHRVYKCVPR